MAVTRRWEWLVSARAQVLVWVPIALVTAAHYTTAAELTWAHDIYRRLYYIPIVLAAFALGLRGALTASVVVSIVYAPHAFGHVMHQDPGASIEKVLEVLLYNGIACITGVLADRERRGRLAQERVAKQLADTVEELRAMEQQLVRSGKLQALGELTAGLAHEIRNPLASLKGATEIISDEIAADSPRRRMVDILYRELQRLEQVLERFLSFARQPRFEVQKLRVADLVEPVVGLMEAQARQSGVSLSWSCPPDLQIEADKQNITLVLMNIVLNAIQATPSGGHVHIRAGRKSRGRHTYCGIAVEDTGKGIPPGDRERIFNPFFTTKDSGVGLGLSIAARIVDGHGGLMEVTEREGGGSVFEVLLEDAGPT